MGLLASYFNVTRCFPGLKQKATLLGGGGSEIGVFFGHTSKYILFM